MKRIAPALALIAAVCGTGPGEARAARQPREATNPSAVIAAEIAFNRMAQEKGQWTAFREFAAKDATMFVPQPVNALQWLKGRADPTQSLQWQPHEVWMSCDGSLGATRGAWQRPDGSTGYFTTVWQRQKKGDYKWVMDQGDALAEPLKAPEMIAGKVADCSVAAPAFGIAEAADEETKVDEHQGWSEDRSLGWHCAVSSDGKRNCIVLMWLAGEMREVLTSNVAAPAP